MTLKGKFSKLIAACSSLTDNGEIQEGGLYRSPRLLQFDEPEMVRLTRQLSSDYLDIQ